MAIKHPISKNMKNGYNFDILNDYLNNKDTFAAIIIQNDQRIFEYGNTTTSTLIASARKSILAILYGMYPIDLSKTLLELKITDVDDLLPIEKTATIRDIISSRSGVYHPASNPGDNPNKPERGSKVPGSFYVYNNWDFNVAGTIFEQVTGISIFDAFDNLGRILGFEDYDLVKNKQDFEKRKLRNDISIHPAYHMFLSARDMTKIGLLMLNNGIWNGKQIVPTEWLVAITSIVSKTTEVNPHYAYGLMWKIFDKEPNHFLHGAYFASGNREQHIFVIPKSNMVIVVKGGNGAFERKEMQRVQYSKFLELVSQVIDFK